MSAYRLEAPCPQFYMEHKTTATYDLFPTGWRLCKLAHCMWYRGAVLLLNLGMAHKRNGDLDGAFDYMKQARHNTDPLTTTIRQTTPTRTYSCALFSEPVARGTSCGGFASHFFDVLRCSNSVAVSPRNKFCDVAGVSKCMSLLSASVALLVVVRSVVFETQFCRFGFVLLLLMPELQKCARALLRLLSFVGDQVKNLNSTRL
eukprot:2686537-Amphidinium_carterae.1